MNSRPEYFGTALASIQGRCVSTLEIAWNSTEDAVARHRNHIFTASNAIEMISIKEESNTGHRRWLLPRQAKGGESRDFHSAALLDADFSQLLAEIGRSVTVSE